MSGFFLCLPNNGETQSHLIKQASGNSLLDLFLEIFISVSLSSLVIPEMLIKLDLASSITCIIIQCDI